MKHRGFSLLEVLIAMAVLAIVMMAYALTEVQTVQSSRQSKEYGIRFTTAEGILSRLQILPFGSPTQGPPTAEQLDALFGSDEVLGKNAPSLTQVSRLSPLWFKLAGIEATGRWTVYVDNDLDGNGIIDEDFREGRSDLYRIAVQYEGRTVVQTIRGASPQQRAVEGSSSPFYHIDELNEE